MSKKKLLVVFSVLLVMLLCLFKIWTLPILSNEYIKAKLRISCDSVDGIEMFYNTKQMTQNIFDQESSTVYKISEVDQYEEFEISIPSNVSQIRIDLGKSISTASIENIYVIDGKNECAIISSVDKDIELINDSSVELTDNKYIMRVNGEDPYVVVNVNSFEIFQGLSFGGKFLDVGVRVGSTVLLTLFLFVLYLKRNFLWIHLKDLYQNRHMVMDLEKNDFKSRFSGSYFGVFWAFTNPIVVVTIYWFVFDVGFRSQPVSDYPYLLWLVAGICPWFFFNEAVNNGTSSLFDYSYIVKKVVFKISLIPIIKILSAVFIHMFFVVLVIALFLVYGKVPSIYVFQMLYYSLCTFMLSLGITYLTSSLAVFFKDLSQIVNIVLQFGMWLTPIMYSEDTFGPAIQEALKLNPMYYVVSGYRDSLIYEIGFWEKPQLTIFFWGVTAVIFVTGRIIFKKMRPHFADVL